MSAHSLEGGVPGTGKLLNGYGYQRIGRRIGPDKGVTTHDTNWPEGQMELARALAKADFMGEQSVQVFEVLRAAGDDEARLPLAKEDPIWAG